MSPTRTAIRPLKYEEDVLVDIDTRTLPLSRSVSARISGPCTTKAQRSPGSILALACGLFGDNNADIFPSGYSFLYEIIGYERTGQSKIWISFILDRFKEECETGYEIRMAWSTAEDAVSSRYISRYSWTAQHVKMCCPEHLRHSGQSGLLIKWTLIVVVDYNPHPHRSYINNASMKRSVNN
ncbi:hypothetical protein BD777DRAFT_151967 [Yarrowia lipolytica]|nr:hypothetical protein BD777DRAFT_151967 [Yarrowia lipolytica]